MLRSRDVFNSLIKEQVDKGIPASRIALGGFSQGGAMSLFTGTTHSEKLAAIFGLSSYLPLSNKINEFMPQDWPNKQTPVFMAHGDADGVVKFEFGQKSADHLREMGMPVEFHKHKLVYRFLFSNCISSSCFLFSFFFLLPIQLFSTCLLTVVDSQGSGSRRGPGGDRGP